MSLDYGQKNRDTPEKLAKAAARKPSTAAQKRAQQENFALFQLTSMRARIEVAEFYFPSTVQNVQEQLDWMIKTIKSLQKDRKQRRKEREKNHG